MATKDLTGEIARLLDQANHFTYGDGADPATGQALATEAIGRGLLALIPLVAEIGDQLDTLRRPQAGPRCDVVDNQDHQCRLFDGHDGPHRIGLDA